MTSFPLPKRKDTLAADAFEARIERSFLPPETLFVLDGGIVMRLCGGCVETSDEAAPPPE